MREQRFLRCFAAAVVACVAMLTAAVVSAQVPIPVQEQVQLFNQMTPAQQQALIREMQQNLPPAQLEAILSQLRGGGQAPADGERGARPDGELQNGAPRFPLVPEQSGTEEPVRLAPGDTVVVDFMLRESFEMMAGSDELQRATEMLDRLVDSNPYELDGEGRLYLPGVPAIQLAGLDIERAIVRIEAESSLRRFTATLTHLPLDPVGTEALEPFGYDFFEFGPHGFLPGTDFPVPADYVVGSGDSVTIQLFGNQNQEYFLPVNRDGTINFPQIGPITVSGLTVTELRNTINERVNEQMIGVRASTTLGELRAIQIFVVGDVEFPGAYTVSGLSTVTNALYASGGVKPIGSLRNITLLRRGETVSTLDLYDLLLRGDTNGDVRLQSGDAIFVPPIGPTVAIDGEVRRPAIYEIEDERSVSALIELAGGLRANASRATVKLERIEPGRGRSVRDIDLSVNVPGDGGIRDGDVIRVLPNLDQLESSVRLAGNVHRPGLYEWFPGMTLSDLLPSSELVKPMSDLNYVLVRRENRANVEVEVLSADLEAIWRQAPGANDIALRPRDTVNVFNLEVGRRHVIEPLMGELQAQSPPNRPVPTVDIGGEVRAPGSYPLEPGMRVSDLLRAGGGMTPSAYSLQAELARFEVVNGEYRETELIDVDLASLLGGNAQADVVLSAYDVLTIREVPRWRDQQSVTLRGEVVFPGTYPIRQGETLSSLLERAGGLTELAFPQGSVFTRVELREREAEQLDTLARRIETDLAAVALSDPAASDAISTGQTLINQLRNAEAVGRLVIDLGGLQSGEIGRDVVLRDGDQLIVPPITQEVMVLGEVQYATSHLYNRELSRNDYIDMSGGVTRRADEKRIYVVRANGSVEARSRSRRWFNRSDSSEIRPGDTIVVPLDTDRVRPLVAWEGITQVLYNIAIAFSVIDRI